MGRYEYYILLEEECKACNKFDKQRSAFVEICILSLLIL